MTTLIIGGTGFIGRRLIPLLAKQGEDSVVMDINPQTANFSELAKVRVLRGDVSQFDDVMAAMTAVKPDRVINLAYYISSDLPPRVAFKLNILGAYEWGVATECVADGELEAATDALVEELCSLPPLAQRTAKKLLNDSEDATLSLAIELEGQAYSRLRSSDDFREGVEAFQAKRKPNFRGS